MASVEGRYQSLIWACRYYNESENGGSIHRSAEGFYSFNPTHIRGSHNSAALFRYIQEDLNNYSSVVKEYKPSALMGVKKASDTIKAKFEVKLRTAENSFLAGIRFYFADLFVKWGWAQDYRLSRSNYQSLSTAFANTGKIYRELACQRRNFDLGSVHLKLQNTEECANRDLSSKDYPEIAFNAVPSKNSPTPQCFNHGAIGTEGFKSSIPTSIKRKTFDDRSFSETLLIEIHGRQRPLSIFGVCDGYNGATAAEYVSKNVKDVLKEKLTEIAKEVNALEELKGDEYARETLIFWNALKQTPIALHKNYLDAGNNPGVGTTLALVIIDGDNVWTANTGDSTVVKINGENVRRLGEEAKKDPSYCRFSDPVVNRGGVAEKGLGIWNLGTPRSIGNGIADEEGNTPSPKITRTKFDGDLVIATDGLWNVCSPIELKEFCKDKEAKYLPSELAKQARDHGSTDDITVLTVLKKKL